jgi:hypothetical protein
MACRPSVARQKRCVVCKMNGERVASLRRVGIFGFFNNRAGECTICLAPTWPAKTRICRRAHSANLLHHPLTARVALGFGRCGSRPRVGDLGRASGAEPSHQIRSLLRRSLLPKSEERSGCAASARPPTRGGGRSISRYLAGTITPLA